MSHEDLPQAEAVADHSRGVSAVNSLQAFWLPTRAMITLAGSLQLSPRSRGTGLPGGLFPYWRFRRPKVLR